jgi:hypothetical protein
MEGNFKQKASPTATLVEGMIAAVEDESGVPVVDALTSATATPWSGAPAAPDYPWLILQGMDQSDAAFVDKVTCLAMQSGLVLKVETLVSFAVGDLVFADAGVLAKVAASQQAIGQVIEVNTSGGYVVVAT